MVAGRRQRYLSQNLFVDQLRLTPDANDRYSSFSLSAEVAINKDADHSACPKGFEIIEAQLEGRSQLIGGASVDYCRGKFSIFLPYQPAAICMARDLTFGSA